jgi:hypothetical protein
VEAIEVLADVSSVVVFAGGFAVVIAAGAVRPRPWLAPARLACLALAALLVAARAVHAIDRWAQALACSALLLGLLSAAVAFGQVASLRSYLERGEWWDEFERGFRHHVARRERLGRLRRRTGR